MAQDGHILLIRMGGTIDAEPYPDPRNPPVDVTPLHGEKSPVLRVMKSFDQGKIESQAHTDAEKYVKDSKKITQGDLEEVADFIRKDQHRYFIITHGTDAMVDNAAALKGLLRGMDKIVAFTGAMVPLSMHDETSGIASDGIPALRHTIENIASQPAGVYAVGIDKGTGKYAFLDPEGVRKDRGASLGHLQLILKKRQDISACLG